MSTLKVQIRAFLAHDILRLATLVALAVFLFDWATKSWALRTLHDLTLPLGALILSIERNAAFAFSAGAGSVPPWLTLAVRLSAIPILIYMSRRVVMADRRFAVGLALLLGGGIGNAADVVFRGGSVVDFIGAGPFTFLWAGEHWHVSFFFNLADVAILLGLAAVAPNVQRWAVAQQRRIAQAENGWLRRRAHGD